MPFDIKDSELIIPELYKEISELKAEVSRLNKVLEENDLLDEALPKVLSPEEEICIKGIQLILDKVRLMDFDKHDIANYDILHKNLRMIRNQPTETKKTKPTNVKDLLKIVEGSGG